MINIPLLDPIRPGRDGAPAAPEIFTVAGMRASSNEYYVSLALDSIPLGYLFQYPLLGGRGRLGGGVLDFLVLTEPKRSALYVHGDYWHRDNAEAFRILSRLPASFRTELNWPPVILWGEETSTPELALMAVRKAYG